MKAASSFALAVSLLSLFAGVANAQKRAPSAPSEQPTVTINSDYLERTWGIKVTGSRVHDEGAKSKSDQETVMHFYLTLEFTKDITDATELNAMKQAFALNVKEKDQWAIVWWLFDRENVLVGKVGELIRLQGELTGQKGDAFRIEFRGPPNAKIFYVGKVSARAGEKKADVKPAPEEKPK